MKWLKKINQLFTHKDLRDDYEEHEEEQHTTTQHVPAPLTEESKAATPKRQPLEVIKNEEPVAKESSFRFPLIPDEDNGEEKFLAPPPPPPKQQPQRTKKEPKKSVNIVLENKHEGGLRAILAQRQQQPFQTHEPKPIKALRYQEPVMPQSIVEEPPVMVAPPEEESVNTIFETKRFTPTIVPSPVYGYGEPTALTKKTTTKEPSTINQLLDKHRQEPEQANPVTASEELSEEQRALAQQSIIQTAMHAYEATIPSAQKESTNDELYVVQALQQEAIERTEAQHATEEVGEEIKAPQVEAVIEVEPTLQLQIDEAPVQQLEEVQVNDETTSTEPVVMQIQQAQIEELVVQQIQLASPVSEEQEPSAERTTPQQQAVQRHFAEKARPFNVVMLKSDKQKLERKTYLQSLMPHTKTAVTQQAPQETSSAVAIAERPQQALRVAITQDGVVAEQPTRVHIKQAEQSLQQEEIFEEDVEIAAVADEVLPSKSLADEATDTSPVDAATTAERDYPFQPSQQVEEKKVEPNPVRHYTKPAESFLVPPEEDLQDTQWMDEQGQKLIEALSYFQVTAQIESIVQGPAVTQFEITVGHGTKVSKIRNLSDDLKLALAARDIRIQAPIPGKSSIGIEIPNRLSRAVRLSEITTSAPFKESTSPLEAALGLDLTGAPVTIDLRKMPHGLIAGATGSGKSVCINSILVSLLYKAAPHELKLLLIDPKMVELAPFNHIPHLVSPVITDVKAATAALKWAVDEMERRYQLFAHTGVRDLERYNKMADKNNQPGHKLPYILIVIDELADLMMMAPHEVEESICRIAQKARACGIHLIVATQRPSVDVITGLIKSNIPTRIAFMVSSQIDSRTILDAQGAERLLGRGDMLYLGNGKSSPTRLQGTFVTDDEIEEIIEHVRAQGEPDYLFEQDELLRKTELTEETDELFEEICRYVYEQQTASTSAIQRRFSIGYNRAARIVDIMEMQGLISEAKQGNKPRDVFITAEEMDNMFN